MPPRFLTEADAAHYIGMSRSFLRKSRMNGTLPNQTPGPPYIRMGGGRAIRYDVEDLNAWIDRHRQDVKAFPAD